MEVKTDDQGNRYIEQDRPKGDKTQIAYITNAKNWDGKDIVSMRIRRHSGKLKYGVEVAVDDVPEFVAAIVQLLSERTHARE